MKRSANIVALLLTSAAIACSSHPERFGLNPLETERVPEVGRVLAVVRPSQRAGRCGALDTLTCSSPELVSVVVRGAGGGRGLATQFRSACLSHDLCYRHAAATYPETSRADCDEKIQSDADTLCSLINREGWNFACKARSFLTFLGVDVFGSDEFRRLGAEPPSDATYCDYRVVEAGEESAGDAPPDAASSGPASNWFDFRRSDGEDVAVSVSERTTDDPAAPCGHAITLSSWGPWGGARAEHFASGLGRSSGERLGVYASSAQGGDQAAILLSRLDTGRPPCTLGFPPTGRDEWEQRLPFGTSLPSAEYAGRPWGLILRLFTSDLHTGWAESAWVFWRNTELYKLVQYPPLLADIDRDGRFDIVVAFRPRERESHLRIVRLLSREGGRLELLEPFDAQVSEDFHPLRVGSVGSTVLTGVTIDRRKRSTTNGRLRAVVVPLGAPVDADGSVTVEVDCRSPFDCNLLDGDTETVLPTVDTLGSDGSTRLVVLTRIRSQESGSRIRLRLVRFIGEKRAVVTSQLDCRFDGSRPRVVARRPGPSGTRLELGAGGVESAWVTVGSRGLASDSPACEILEASAVRRAS